MQVADIPPYNHTRSIYRNSWLTTVLPTMKFKYQLFSTRMKISLLHVSPILIYIHTHTLKISNFWTNRFIYTGSRAVTI